MNIAESAAIKHECGVAIFSMEMSAEQLVRRMFSSLGQIDQNRLRWDNPLYYQNALPNSADTFRAVRTALFGSHYGLMIGLALVAFFFILGDSIKASASSAIDPNTIPVATSAIIITDVSRTTIIVRDSPGRGLSCPNVCG